jgi:hypothetical protein
MPTDGADFGRMKACYGKAYTAARLAGANSEVADLVVLGIEHDIRRDGGCPAFRRLIDLLVAHSEIANETQGKLQLLNSVENINRQFADWPLTRTMVSAAEAIGLTAIDRGHILDPKEAAEALPAGFGKSRCCDSMSSYLTRNLTQSPLKSGEILDSIGSNVALSAKLSDLAHRMLNGSESGLPMKAQKPSQIDHSASELNDIILDKIL